VGVWDAKIGRFMGTLGSSASCNLLGTPVVIGERLLQRCSAGEVLEWSAEGVRKQLEAFGSQISGAGSSPKIER
jgi:hypothetical protein